MAAAPRQLLAFRLGRDEYAVGVDRVREVVAYETPRHVPTPAPWLRGVISLRGELVAVADLVERLGLEPAPADPAGRQIVVVEGGKGTAGMIVDAVTGIAEHVAPIRELPVGDDALLAGMTELDGRLVLALEVDVLLAEVSALRRKPPPAPRRRRTAASKGPDPAPDGGVGTT